MRYDKLLWSQVRKLFIEYQGPHRCNTKLGNQSRLLAWTNDGERDIVWVQHVIWVPIKGHHNRGQSMLLGLGNQLVYQLLMT